MDSQKLLNKIDSAWQDFNASLQASQMSSGSSPMPLANGHSRTSWGILPPGRKKPSSTSRSSWNGKRLPRYSDMYGGIDAFNAMTVTENRQLTLAEVRERSAQTHQRLLDYLQTLPDELFASGSRVLRRIFLDTYGHYPYHTQAIRQWREHRVGEDPSGLSVIDPSSAKFFLYP